MIRRFTLIRILATILSAALLISAIACSNQAVLSGLDDAHSGAKSVSAAAVAQYGPDDPRTKRYQRWADSIQTLHDDYAKAATPEEQVKLLPALNALIDFFESDVLPNLKIDPIVAAGIDAGLRIAANHFVRSADSVPAAMAAMDSAGSAPAASEVAKLRTAAKKRLRARDAKTGRFVTLDYAKKNPDTTLLERW